MAQRPRYASWELSSKSQLCGSPGHGAGGIRLESSVTQPSRHGGGPSKPSIANLSDQTREIASRQPVVSGRWHRGDLRSADVSLG
jgi:hypothetical protein